MESFIAAHLGEREVEKMRGGGEEYDSISIQVY